MLPRFVVPLILLSSILVSACDGDGQTGPTAPSPSPVPTPPAPVTDAWNITVRMSSVVGGECVGKMMHSDIGVPKDYSLSIRRNGNTADVTLRSASGDYACTFPARMDGDDFTTVGVPGFMSCERQDTGLIRGFACANGSLRDMFDLGEDISGHISGNEIAGEWTATWMISEGGRDIAAMETTSQYRGAR